MQSHSTNYCVTMEIRTGGMLLSQSAEGISMRLIQSLPGVMQSLAVDLPAQGFRAKLG